jgi:hypothetical protein
VLTSKGKHSPVGTLRADMSFLKKDNLIQPIIPDVGEGNTHYKIEFEVLFEVRGRTLFYKAVYPIGAREERSVIEGSGGWTNISAALNF